MGVIPNKKMEANKRMTINTEKENINLTEDKDAVIKALMESKNDTKTHLSICCCLFALAEKQAPDLVNEGFERSYLSKYSREDFENAVKHLTRVEEDIVQGKAKIKTDTDKEAMLEMYGDVISYINRYLINIA